MNKTTAIILAAGKSSRMGGGMQKSFYEVGGEKLMIHLLDKICDAGFDNIFIVINRDYLDWQLRYIEDFLHKKNTLCDFVYQDEQLGTGHAILTCINSEQYKSKTHEDVVIFYADTPLIELPSIVNLKTQLLHEKSGLICGFVCDKESQYGRIVLDDSKKFVEKIIEYKDYKNDIDVQKIKLCNSGIFAIKNQVLVEKIGFINSQNNANEYYLFDILNYIDEKFSFFEINEDEAIGINNFYELSMAERIWQKRQRNFWMIKMFVQMQDPHTVFFSFHNKIGRFAKIGSNVEIKNHVEIGENVVIESNNVIGANVKIGKNTKIKSFSYICDTEIGENCEIGPFASLTSNNFIDNGNIVGNFVEIKRSKLGEGNKIKHLSYIGDVEMGMKNNVGAGMITCNYDGKKKHITKVENQNFFGANSCIIAPITIGSGNILGAGSVMTSSVDDDNLIVERGEEKIKKRKK